MILMPQIQDLLAYENARYKQNELEYMYVCFDYCKQSICFEAFYFRNIRNDWQYKMLQICLSNELN